MQTTSEAPAGPSGLTLALTPLLTHGVALLAPEPSLGIAKVLLVKAGSRWHNALNESTVRKADDLFARNGLEGAYYDPFPKGAELTGVTLEFYFAGAPDPHWVELTPPARLSFQHPADRPAVLEFLKRRRLIISS